MSWIHHRDYLSAVLSLLDDQRCEGPTIWSRHNRLAMPVLRNVWRRSSRPAVFSTPAFVLKLVLGERAVLVLEGSHIAPQRLLEQGFQFQFNDLSLALSEIIQAG